MVFLPITARRNAKTPPERPREDWLIFARAGTITAVVRRDGRRSKNVPGGHRFRSGRRDTPLLPGGVFY